MLRKFGWIIVFAVIVFIIAAVGMQLQMIQKKMLSLEEKMDRISKGKEALSVSPDAGKRGHELTINMWKEFEEELQDYKQRLREGKQQYSEQQANWNSVLSELKKSLQEYDKFITAEGDFWEKQLKNYDKLLARADEKFEALGQVVEEMRNVVSELQSISLGKEGKTGETEAGTIPTEEQSEVPERIGEKIEPKIKGTGDYKTYPVKEEKETSTKEKSGEIKGKVTGSGEYKTY